MPLRYYHQGGHFLQWPPSGPILLQSCNGTLQPPSPPEINTQEGCNSPRVFPPEPTATPKIGPLKFVLVLLRTHKCISLNPTGGPQNQPNSPKLGWLPF